MNLTKKAHPTQPQLCFLFSFLQERNDLLRQGGVGQASTTLYGYPLFAKRGWQLSFNFARMSRSWRDFFYLGIAKVISLAMKSLRAPLGSWQDVWGAVPELRQADVVFSTSDRVGIAAAALKWLGLYRAPLIYTSIGLPERLQLIESSWLRALVIRIVASSHAIVCYGHKEKFLLEELFGHFAVPVHFVPFGVDTNYFLPTPASTRWDVLSIGRDIFRDYELLFRWARESPGYKTRVILGAQQAEQFKDQIPRSVDILIDIPLAELREQFTMAKVIVFPLRENSYSGATTSLLQAMAMGKPVIVSRVGAIEENYFLKHGHNCLFVTVGNLQELKSAIDNLMQNEALRDSMGRAARFTAQTQLSDQRFCERLEAIFAGALNKR